MVGERCTGMVDCLLFQCHMMSVIANLKHSLVASYLPLKMIPFARDLGMSITQ